MLSVMARLLFRNATPLRLVRTRPRGRQIIIITISTPNSSTRYSSKPRSSSGVTVRNKRRQYHSQGGAHSPEHHNRRDQRRLKKGERRRVNKPLIAGEEHPGDPGRRRAEHKRRELHQHVIEPHRPTGDLILSQRLPGAADGHPRQAMLHQQHQHHHQAQHGVEKDEFQVGVVADVEKLMDGDAAILGPAGKLEAKQRGGMAPVRR